MHWHHPVLSCAESLEFESTRFDGNVEKAAAAMECAGTALAHQLIKDLGVRFSGSCRCCLLLGKGHNAGDAIIAACLLLQHIGGLQVVAVPLWDPAEMSPAVRPWWQRLIDHPRVQVEALSNLLDAQPVPRFDLSIDGVFGMQFRAPLSESLKASFDAVNAWEVAVRVAVDLPSGLNDHANSPVLRADFTYATGIFKSPLAKVENLEAAGRVRYLDIGFFEQADRSTRSRVAHAGLLQSLAALRPVRSDKRSYGHLLIVAGSRRMPGALLMTVKGALRSGVGLVTVLAPESVAPQFAASVPEAMWVPWPETPEGGLALEGVGALEQYRERITAILLGPGCGREAETQALLDDVIDRFSVPVVLDADALTRARAMRLQSRCSPVVMTPHEGEFRRIAGMDAAQHMSDEALGAFAEKFNHCIVVLKGPLTRMSDGEQILLFPLGNPILARGGSGDILAGLVSGKVANAEKTALNFRVAQAVACHAYAADRLFSCKEETHVCTTDILNFLNQY